MPERNGKVLEGVLGSTMEVDAAMAKELGAPAVQAGGSCPLFDREDGSEVTCAHCSHAVVSGGVYYCLHYKHQTPVRGEEQA